MPISRKKLAAKKRLEYQVRNLNSRSKSRRKTLDNFYNMQDNEDNKVNS